MTNGNFQFSTKKIGPWELTVVSVMLMISLIVFLFPGEIKAAISIWIHSGTYNHCFLILPIFLYMLWCDRTTARDLTPQPSLWGGGVILTFAGLWLVCSASGVAEGAQFSIIGMIQGVLLSFLGRRIYVRLLIPFCFLWLLVPSGEFIVPTLQLITAKAAATLLDVVGIPTFRDGIAIDVPSGSYLVAPGCSGLNFILAALTIAAAYAELIYRGWCRRLIFVLALLALAVIGNALRVFLIIAIAHATNNVGNIVDNHLLYGWGFFSLLLLAAMAVGQRFRQDLAPTAAAPLIAPIPQRPASAGSILMVGAVVAILVSVAPVTTWSVRSHEGEPAVVTPVLSCHSWETLSAEADWPATVKQVDAMTSIDCGRAGTRVHMAVAVLERPVRLGKLLGVEHWLEANEDWNRIDRRKTSIAIAGRAIPAQADTEALGVHRRLVWSLFWAGGGWQRPGWRAAAADLAAELVGRRRAVLVLAATAADRGEPAAAQVLGDFLADQPLAQLTNAP
jgi:exosortase A